MVINNQPTTPLIPTPYQSSHLIPPPPYGSGDASIPHPSWFNITRLRTMTSSSTLPSQGKCVLLWMSRLVVVAVVVVVVVIVIVIVVAVALVVVVAVNDTEQEPLAGAASMR